MLTLATRKENVLKTNYKLIYITNETKIKRTIHGSKKQNLYTVKDWLPNKMLVTIMK